MKNKKNIFIFMLINITFFVNLFAETNYDIGTQYLDQHDYYQAIREFKLYIQEEPQSSRAYNNLGFCYFKLKQYDLAEEAYLQAIVLDNNYSIACNNVGIIYYIKENYDKALYYYNKAIQSNNKNVKALINMAIIYGKLNNKKKAKQLFRNAKKIDKNYVKKRIKHRVNQQVEIEKFNIDD